MEDRRAVKTHSSYLPMVIAIAILIILNIVIVSLSLFSNEQNAEIINISGRQRMLSQKIKAAVVYNYLNGKPVFDESTNLDVLKWKQVHENLKNGDENFNVSNSFSLRLKYLISLDEYIDFTYEFLHKKDDTTDQNLTEFIENQDQFLIAMDALVDDLQEQSELGHGNLILSTLGLSIFSLVLLFLLYRFLLKSTAEQLANQADMLITKNKQLEHFAYVASHDLQEPLRTVTNYLEIFEEDYGSKLDDDSMQYFRFINEATQRMRNLIQGLLTYSRLGNSGKQESVDIARILEDIKKDFAKTLQERNITIMADNMPTVNGFNIELRQLFQNLISNGIKFSKSQTNPIIKISYKERNATHEFAVKDNGIGMESKNLDKIFDMFSRLHSAKAYQGQGIGLAFCKKIVELHHGQIWAKSKVDVGTTIYFNISK